jgi:hypothetical protein
LPEERFAAVRVENVRLMRFHRDQSLAFSRQSESLTPTAFQQVGGESAGFVARDSDMVRVTVNLGANTVNVALRH